VRIKAHPGLCQGHGLCRRFAPSVYQLDDEGYLDLHLVAIPPHLEADAELGATVCPAGAITVLRNPVAVPQASPDR
jgi:ferredoxin